MLALANSPLASRAWRIQNLYTILDADGKLVPFVPNLAQREFYNNLWYCNHVLKARKLGFSTLIEILNLDDALFIPNLVCGIVDKTMDDAKKKLRMVKLAYDQLDNKDLHPETWQIGRAIKKAVGIKSSTAESLEFLNGSVFFCGVSLRGGTINRLHVSELGATAVKAPQKAEEIVTGAFNALTPGNRIDIESTHEGGRIGVHYRLLRKAMLQAPDQLTAVDFRFHFFAWWQDPRYTLHDGFAIRPEIEDYFARLTRDTGRTFTMGQMLWYDRKQLTQGHGMKKEFPSTPGEAFEAISENAIYGKEMADLRAAGRISKGWTLEKHLPIYSFWDIGLSDYTSVWLIQPVGRAILVLDWLECEGVAGSGMPDLMRLWERKWEKPITCHFLPHDADTRDRGTGKSYAQTLKDSKIGEIKIVPRTPDVWLGIGHTRDILPHCWFLADTCDAPRVHGGQEYPSGVACLEGYQKAMPGASGTLREMPLHDAFSHSSDAFRTFAEAWRRGMVNPDGQSQTPPRALGGVGPRARR